MSQCQFFVWLRCTTDIISLVAYTYRSATDSEKFNLAVHTCKLFRGRLVFNLYVEGAVIAIAVIIAHLGL